MGKAKRKVSMDEAKEIYAEYHDLPCWEAIVYVTDTSRKTGISRSMLYKIIKAKERFSKIESD